MLYTYDSSCHVPKSHKNGVLGRLQTSFRNSEVHMSHDDTRVQADILHVEVHKAVEVTRFCV